MFRDEVVRIQEVPKRSDYNPSTTIYLWTIEKVQLERFVRRTLLKCLMGARLRGQHLYERDRELISNAKSNKIIPGAAEAEIYNNIVQSLSRLDHIVHHLDETLLLWTS